MEKEFVPYEPSFRMKAIGFDEPCFIYYKASNENKPAYPNYGFTQNSLCSNGITAPTFSQAFRWFREKHELFCWIEKFHVDETYIFQIPPANFTKIQGHYITYEEAELACLKKLIEIVESKSE